MPAHALVCARRISARCVPHTRFRMGVGQIVDNPSMLRSNLWKALLQYWWIPIVIGRVHIGPVEIPARKRSRICTSEAVEDVPATVLRISQPRTLRRSPNEDAYCCSPRHFRFCSERLRGPDAAFRLHRFQLHAARRVGLPLVAARKRPSLRSFLSPPATMSSGAAAPDDTADPFACFFRNSRRSPLPTSSNE